VTRTHVPDEILDLAHARKQAREDRDWAEADRLRGEIEAAGWKVVDRGTDFALAPAHPPDVAEAGRVRYGRSASVPSRLEEPVTGLATVVIVADEPASDAERALRALRQYSPPGVSLVAASALPDLDAGEAEVVWTTEPLGQGGMLNAAIRRASGPIVVVLDPSVEPTGDVISPLVGALEDPTVAVAGGWGVTSRDLRQFQEAPHGDVAAIEGYLMAFRRDDYRACGPLDEKFRFYRNLDLWWSLVLRDEGEGSPPRRAVAVPGVPAVRHEHHAWATTPAEERDRLSKRNFYRIIDRFGPRRDLAVPG
jgi:hypothetical protein